MTMVSLSTQTRRHLTVLFPPADQETAERLLLAWSTDLRDPSVSATPEGWERLRFSALRLSRGDIGKLKQAIDLGMQDWRDLLVAADFADDVHAHELWRPRKLTNDLLQTWMAGSDIPDVRFHLNDLVEVYGGEHPSGTRGAVVALVDFEPEPQYTVELGSGQYVQVRESWLWKAG